MPRCRRQDGPASTTDLYRFSSAWPRLGLPRNTKRSRRVSASPFFCINEYARWSDRLRKLKGILKASALHFDLEMWFSSSCDGVIFLLAFAHEGDLVDVNIAKILDYGSFLIRSSHPSLCSIRSRLPFWPNSGLWLGPDGCLLYTSPSPRDATLSRMPSSA